MIIKVLSSILALILAIVVNINDVTAGDYNPEVLRVALLPDENAATIIQDNKEN